MQNMNLSNLWLRWSQVVTIPWSTRWTPIPANGRLEVLNVNSSVSSTHLL